MDFTVNITIKQDFHRHEDKTLGTFEDPMHYSIGIRDIPDLHALYYELQNLVNEIATIKAIDMMEIQSSDTLVVSVIGECFGIKKYHRIYVDGQFRETVRKNKKKESKAPTMVDLEGLHHDISYGITMLRTMAPDTWMKAEPIVWLYYTLHKRFGDPLPEEILKAKSELKEEPKKDESTGSSGAGNTQEG